MSRLNDQLHDIDSVDLTVKPQIKQIQGPVVQSMVNLTSLLVVKMLTVLVGIFAEKMFVAFANAKATHIFFSKNNNSENNNSIYAIFNDQSFNSMLTNDIVSFEQLGPEVLPDLSA